MDFFFDELDQQWVRQGYCSICGEFVKFVADSDKDGNETDEELSQMDWKQVSGFQCRH